MRQFRRWFDIGLAPFLQNFVLSKGLPKNIQTWVKSPGGPFTIFFWTPFIKWSFANLQSIFNRPLKQVSTLIQCVLVISGLTWCRWSFVIYPKNYSLAAVNFFMSSVACYQIYRKYQAGQLIDFL